MAAAALNNVIPTSDARSFFISRFRSHCFRTSIGASRWTDHGIPHRSFESRKLAVRGETQHAEPGSLGVGRIFSSSMVFTSVSTGTTLGAVVSSPRCDRDSDSSGSTMIFCTGGDMTETDTSTSASLFEVETGPAFAGFSFESCSFEVSRLEAASVAFFSKSACKCRERKFCFVTGFLQKKQYRNLTPAARQEGYEHSRC